ncbi:hypothetical protein [Kitasatospora azatica]|uniref:hypothetical protein n=1 Tax=Kitasatospora azatica TaxID=58347 RepID=UPI000562D143|nr:hypothetical protein [Kitasatospora azatica]
METLDVNRSWEQPTRQGEEPDVHPAGEIRLWTAGALGRRANLLSSDGAVALSLDPFETMTMTSGNCDGHS